MTEPSLNLSSDHRVGTFLFASLLVGPEWGLFCWAGTNTPAPSVLGTGGVCQGECVDSWREYGQFRIGCRCLLWTRLCEEVEEYGDIVEIVVEVAVKVGDGFELSECTKEV